eukprot:1085915-Pelagomonas_calceolata.AAC.1
MRLSDMKSSWQHSCCTQITVEGRWGKRLECAKNDCEDHDAFDPGLQRAACPANTGAALLCYSLQGGHSYELLIGTTVFTLWPFAQSEATP